MSKYNVVLQLLAILFICFVLYLLYSLIIAIIRKKRIDYFSVNLTDVKDDKINPFFQVINVISELLTSMVIFNGIAKIYDKYVNKDSNRLTKGMDYISIKLVTGIGVILLYIFLCFLSKDSISLLLILICFVIGYLIPDFFCLNQESLNKERVNKHMLSAIIIMNNSFKANRNTEQAINDVTKRIEGPIKHEFNKVLNDIKLGITVGEAFHRMYLRTKMDIILEVSDVLMLAQKTGINLADIFDTLEKRLIEEENFNNKIYSLNKTNKMTAFVFGIMPIVFIAYIVLCNRIYLELILSPNGVYYVAMFGICYVLYLLIIYKIVKGGIKNV